MSNDRAQWSPYWRDLEVGGVAEAKRLGLEVVPWTLNAPDDIATMIAMGIDGPITDYPDRAVTVLAQMGVAMR